MDQAFQNTALPLPQMPGIAGPGYATHNNSPTPAMARQVYLNGGIFFVVISLYSVFWIKFRMKKGVFEPEPMEEAISDWRSL